MFSLSLPVQTTPIARPSLSMIGEPDIPPTVLAPVIHSGPPKLCTRQACHRRSSDKRNAQSWQNSYLGKPSISFSARGNATYSPVIQLLTCDLWASISVLSASKCLQPSVMRNRCSNVGLPQFVIACAG